MARFNGTKDLLDADEVFTMDLQAGREDWVVGMVFADQPGSLEIWQSMDGVNWDYQSVANAILASTGEVFKEEVYAPFIRIEYTNGATPQGVFRLTARFSNAGHR